MTEMQTPLTKDAAAPAYAPVATEPTDRSATSTETKPEAQTLLPKGADPEKAELSSPVDEKKPEPESPLTTFGKWFSGVEGAAPPPAPPLTYSAASFLGALIGICTLGLLVKFTGVIFLVGSFGAMAVLIFSVIGAPVAQPRNVILGNTIGGAVGVAVFKLFAALELKEPWLAAGLVVATTIFLQERTRSVHPPGGATALIFILGPAKVQAYGWLYILCPIFAGSCIMVLIAFFFNRAVGRTYPQYWW